MEEALCIELEQRGLRYIRQVDIKIPYKDVILRTAYRADLLVEDKIIVDTKATTGLTRIDEAQLFNYLKATRKKVGLLVNFGMTSLEWKRFICETYFQPKE